MTDWALTAAQRIVRSIVANGDRTDINKALRIITEECPLDKLVLADALCARLSAFAGEIDSEGAVECLDRLLAELRGLRDESSRADVDLDQARALGAEVEEG